MQRLAFHSENGPAIGGSDYYLGKIVDGLDRDHYTPLLYVRPDYPVSDIVSGPLPAVLGADSTQETTIGHKLATGTRATHRARVFSPRGLLRTAWLRSPSAFRRAVGFRKQAARAKRVIASSGASLFHAMDGGPIIEPVGARQAGAAVVVNYSAPPPSSEGSLLSRRVSRACYRAADVCLAKSRYTANAWRDWIGVTDDKFEVIPNGEDFALLDAEERRGLRREIGVPEGAVVVGMTGGMVEVKGPLVMMAAAAEILRHHPNAFFVFTGGGGLVDQLKRDAGQKGMAERVAVVGQVPKAWRYAAAYDIAVVPSLWEEPFGWVVIEAMAQSTPVVASRVGGIPEILDDGIDGLLFERGDSRALAERVMRLIENPDLRSELGKSGLIKQRTSYSRRAMLEPTYALYHQLLSERSKRGSVTA